MWAKLLVVLRVTAAITDDDATTVVVHLSFSALLLIA